METLKVNADYVGLLLCDKLNYEYQILMPYKKKTENGEWKDTGYYVRVCFECFYMKNTKRTGYLYLWVYYLNDDAFNLEYLSKLYEKKFTLKNRYLTSEELEKLIEKLKERTLKDLIKKVPNVIVERLEDIFKPYWEDENFYDANGENI